jgi:hypothetical protein
LGLRTLWPEAKAQPAISLEEADHLARGDGVNLCIGGPYLLLLTGQQTRQHQATPLVDCPQDAGGQDFEWLRQDVGHHQVEAAALACRSGLNADSISNAVDLCIVRCGLKRQWVDVNGSDLAGAERGSRNGKDARSTPEVQNASRPGQWLADSIEAKEGTKTELGGGMAGSIERLSRGATVKSAGGRCQWGPIQRRSSMTMGSKAACDVATQSASSTR